MPQPTPRDVHIDAALTNVSIAYIQSAAAYVADRVFPNLPVEKQTDKYFTYNRGDWFRDEAAVRPPASESAGSGYRLSTDSYACDIIAFHKDVPQEVEANQDPAIDSGRDAAEYVTQVLLINRENAFASTYFTTSVWTTDKTGGTHFARWDDDANSDPLADIVAGKTTILTSTGFLPNTLLLGYPVYEALKKHPLVVERYKYTSAESITAAMLARLFEVDRVLVAAAIKNTGKEGATDAMSLILGKHALLCYSNPRPSLLTPSAGYTFTWRNMTTANGLGVRTNRIPVPLRKADRIEGEMAYDLKKVAADLGYFFNTAVS